jgi:hypothetical protein
MNLKMTAMTLAVSLFAVPAFAAERVCLGEAWGQLTQAQKQAFVNEFKAAGGIGNPSSCRTVSANAESSIANPQPAKATQCSLLCDQDQVAMLAACGLGALLNPLVSVACNALAPVYTSACKGNCVVKYGPIP